MNGDIDARKRAAAERAASLAEDGMVLGLGTGSTAALALVALAARIRDGLRVVGIPSSRATEMLATQLGIPLVTLADHPTLDLTIDGADEVDPALDLIKGAGGALLREKVLAAASRRLVIVVDDSKLVRHLGQRSALPVEVVPFALPPPTRPPPDRRDPDGDGQRQPHHRLPHRPHRRRAGARPATAGDHRRRRSWPLPRADQRGGDRPRSGSRRGASTGRTGHVVARA
jgi:hypothetical protein